MDVIENLSTKFCTELLPTIRWELEIAYTITMVMMAAKTADREWHKTNLFYSYLRALLYAKGADLIMAICLGNSPLQAISSNSTLFTVGIIWWLVLFVPFDAFNSILNLEAGDVKPLLFLLSGMTALRQVVVVDRAVGLSLKTYPKSYVAVFTGTVSGNGCLIVSAVFGDFARAISSHKVTNAAFVTAVVITLTKILSPGPAVVHYIALAACSLLLVLLELLDVFGYKVELFNPVYDLIRRIVVTCDLLDPNYR